jgi:hypothetical protein
MGESSEGPKAMTDTIDYGLARLKAVSPERDLSRLESAVWARIDQNRRETWGGLKLQLAVSCGALLLGLAVAHFADAGLMPQRLGSEMVVLSDDSAMAPSVRLEGGI